MVKNVFLAVFGFVYDNIVEQTTDTPEELGAGGFLPPRREGEENGVGLRDERVEPLGDREAAHEGLSVEDFVKDQGEEMIGESVKVVLVI